MANQSNLVKDNTTIPDPTSPTRNSKKDFVTFVLPAATKDEKDRHALVLLPKTYDVRLGEIILIILIPRV